MSQMLVWLEVARDPCKACPFQVRLRCFLPEVVAVGDLEIPLIFPNGVADPLKQFILADFKVIFEFSEDYEVYELNRGVQANERDVNVNGVDYMVKRRLSFRSSRPPSLLHKKLGDLVDQNGVDKLVVPEIVVDEYKEAFELVRIYSDEFKALGDFVKLVTDSSGESPFLLHPKDVFYMPGSPILMRLEEDPRLVGEAQRYYSEATRVRMPSVLEFEEIPQDQQKHGIYLKAKGWALDGEPPTPSVEVGFVFHDGRWKIVGR